MDRALALLGRWTKDGLIPGAALYVAQHGRVLAHQAFGQVLTFASGHAAPRQVEPETIFVIASPTKPLTAAAVALLIERGQLLLNDPVSMYVPEYQGQDRRDTRILHLMTHTSGLPGLLPENDDLSRQGAPLEAFVRYTCTTPLLFPPGKGYHYSCPGIHLLGEIVERIERVPLRQFLYREFQQPLGMSRSYLGWGTLPREQIARPVLSPEEENRPWNINSDYWRDLGVPWGGMHASVRDYGFFLQMLLDGGRVGARQILSRATVEMMLADHILSLPGLDQSVKLEQAWGLAWRINRPCGSLYLPELGSPRTFGHHGATGTVAWADPEKDLVCVVFTNQPKAARLLGLVSNAVVASVSHQLAD